MKVVAGKYKGFNILSPKSKTSRPTDNKVKEAILNKTTKKLSKQTR